ncbi:hypothetical protein FHX15_005156 [Rhizobium sp. BK650]|nr:hypothetical protein [Rhizobium sp. BK650]MBB3659887.1 hypothetical protein [Rhizobium sp. BK650]
MTIIDDRQRVLSRQGAAWLSPVCLRLHQTATAGSFIFILALVFGLV